LGLGGVKTSVRQTFLKSLVAVITGNLIYYFALMPILPMAGRHRPMELDLGLVIDFWVCLVVVGFIELMGRIRARRSQRS
jgi:ABC-type uncharacterized transport system permease subunit